MPAAFDRNIQSPEALDSLVDQRSNIVFVAHIGANELGLCASRPQLFGQGQAGLVVTAGRDDFGALGGKGQCGGAGDSGRCR